MRAIAHFQKVVALNPTYTEAHYRLGHIFEYQGKTTQALECYKQVQSLDPTATDIEHRISLAKRRQCDWRDYTVQTQALQNYVEQYIHLTDPAKSAPSFSPFILSTFPVSLPHHKAAAIQHAKSIQQSVEKIKATLTFAHSKQTPEKLRIGYLSPDFRNHAVGRLIYQIFSCCDRAQFTTYAYQTVDVNDAITQQIREGCDTFRNLSSLSTAAAAQHIYDDGIHILIDLAGYTTGNGNRILALQPAPIQAHWMGYPDTLGADCIQHYFGDATLLPPNIAQHYTEEIVYLPHAFVASPIPISDKVTTRADHALPEESFVFCCFNAHYKITPALFDCWMRILAQVPNSVLWLATGEGQENLKREAKKRDCDPSRLIFADKIPHDEYLARYAIADLCLDTWIYTAGSTAAATLWAGLPLLTCTGDTNASRMGASICAAANLPEMICETTTDYEQQAIHLATHPEILKPIRKRLQTALQSEETYPPLFRTKSFMSTFEQSLQKIWQQFAEG